MPHRYAASARRELEGAPIRLRRADAGRVHDEVKGSTKAEKLKGSFQSRSRVRYEHDGDNGANPGDEPKDIRVHFTVRSEPLGGRKPSFAAVRFLEPTRYRFSPLVIGNP